MKSFFRLYDPLRKGLINDLPHIIGLLHFEHDPVATVVHYINSENAFLQTPELSEVKFAQAIIRFNCPGELYVFLKFQFHSLLLSAIAVLHNLKNLRKFEKFLTNLI
jgi:hypothetical protein